MSFKMKDVVQALLVLAVIGAVIYFMMFKKKPETKETPKEEQKEQTKEEPQDKKGSPTEVTGKGAGGTAVPKP